VKSARIRQIAFGVSHSVVFASALTAAFLLRFEFLLPDQEWQHLSVGIALAVPLKLIVWWAGGGFRKGSWRFAGMADMQRVVLSNLGASLAFAIATRMIVGAGFPRSIYVIDLMISLLATGTLRLAGRIAIELRSTIRPLSARKNVLIYGAGAAGVSLVREIRSNPALCCEILGFLDDDPTKRNTALMRVKVLGAGRDAPRIVERFKKRGRRVDEIIVAMPSATGRQVREAVANCRAAGVTCRIVPGLADLLTGKVLSRQVRKVRMDEVLGREPVEMDEKLVRTHLAGRSVMVTGAAGSIGSEICRQILRTEASRLVLVDRAESDMYRIELELARQGSRVQVVTEMGDIQDFARMNDSIRRNSVEMIFHAAAYKHVPMMESHVCEAVKNNILGTWNLVKAARQNSVASFLMISSDKAVRPSSIMGATKRAAELLLSSMQNSSTRFVSVRFGNVLGSNGSVIPLFEAQIAAGGPVTVTHPDVKRYFMTTQEAVQLVLQASAMGNDAEIFVLDMGEPVRILDLARNLIRLAGFEPEEDIDIRVIGMRPGEKLFEELSSGGEDLRPTHHPKIRVCKTATASRAQIEKWLESIHAAVERYDEAGLRSLISHLVPEYADPMDARSETDHQSKENSVEVARA
jgi:FlaA1/EpsC-like NDP-sugar epimerase